MTTDLKATCLRFEQHCDECKECAVFTLSVRVEDSIQHLKFGFSLQAKPHLCIQGKWILLEIFE